MLDDPWDTGLFSIVAQLSARWDRQFRAEMAARGYPWHLTAAGDLLRHLSATPMSQSALTAMTGLSKQAVQQLLDQLEAQGVLRRLPDPADKRARQIHLTAVGEADLAARSAVLAEIEEQVRDQLGKKTAKKLRKTLRSLATG